MKGSLSLLTACILVSVLVLGCRAKPVATPSTTTPASAPTSTTAPPTTAPSPSDGKYRPPQGNYACDFSLAGGTGARLDEHYWPTFEGEPDSFETVQSNDFGGWKSIEFVRISDADLPVPAEYLDGYLEFDLNALMEHHITPEIPQGRIVYQEYLQKDTTILFAVLVLPSGSNMLMNGEHLDAIRGVYIVIQGAYSYVISTQISTGMSQSKTQKEYIQQLKQDLESFYGGIEFETDLDVGRDFVPPPPTPAPNPIDWIPDMKIPKGLFFPDMESSNFSRYGGKALMTKGDWILYMASIRSILPVPKGWTTDETGQGTYIMFIPTGNSQGEFAIRISLGFYCYYEDDSTTSNDPIAEVLESIKDLTNVTVIRKEIIDADRGYLFLKVKTDFGTNRYLLQYTTKSAMFNDGWGYTFSVYTDERDWDQYYPIIVAIVKNWYTSEGVFIGAQLPNTLVK
jgi:hypothetical protein